MMRVTSFVHYVIAIIFSALVIKVDGAPRYAPSTPQVGEVESTLPIYYNSNPRKMTSPNNGTMAEPNANVLERIKQEAQSCKTVVVKFLQRPLKPFNSLAVGKMVQAYDESLVHVQVVAYDKQTKKIIDNFGFTGDFTKAEPGKILEETPTFIQEAYNESESLGEVEMSSDCYQMAKEATVNQLAIYAPFNKYNRDYEKMVQDGMSAGSDVGEMMGGALGTAAGLAMGWPMGAGGVGGKLAGGALGTLGGGVGGSVAAIQMGFDDLKNWERDGRHDYLQYSDEGKQMSFPGFNCHIVPELFIKNAESDPTFKVIPGKEYRQPGESGKKPTANDESLVASIDTSKLEALLKGEIECLETLLARRKDATKSDIYYVLWLGNEIDQEAQKIAAMEIPDEVEKGMEEKVGPLIKRMADLLASGVVLGLWTFKEIEGKRFYYENPGSAKSM